MMLNPMVILLALAAIAVSPVAAQDLSDEEIIGIVAGSVAGFIILMIMMLCCCYCCFCQNQPEPLPMVVQGGQRPVIRIPGPPQPPRLITRIFPWRGGPPIIKEDNLQGLGYGPPGRGPGPRPGPPGYRPAGPGYY